MRIELKQVLFPQPKSKIKAGDGKAEGKYKFFTSSPIQSKFVDEANYDKPSLIFGTGGNASVHFCNEPFSTSTDCLVMYGRSKTELETIYNYLKSNIGILENGFKGAGLKHISKDYILAIVIDLPSEEIQLDFLQKNRIIDGLIEAKQAQLHLSEELVKSRFIEMFGDPESNPYGYPTKKLSEIASYWNGLTYKPEDVQDQGTIVLRSSNIQNSQLDFEDTVRVTCRIREKQYVQNNDILMCSRNGSAKLVGKVALITNITEPMSFGAFMMIIRSDYHRYLMTYFQMDAFRNQIKTGATTTINQITGNMLNQVTLPVPDLSVVSQFAAFVEQTDKSKFYIVQTQKIIELLIRAIQYITKEVLS